MKKNPALKNCRILCEAHDFILPRTTALLVERFQKTHQIQLIHEKPRNPDHFRILDGLSEIDKLIAITETKHIEKRLTPGRFIYLKPKV